MRRLRVRFTVRRLMAVVAIVALALGVETLRRRSNEFRERARDHGMAANVSRAQADLQLEERDEALTERCERPLDRVDVGREGDRTELAIALTPEETAQICRRQAAYEMALRCKYEYAAVHPWLPVEPDPPEP